MDEKNESAEIAELIKVTDRPGCLPHFCIIEKYLSAYKMIHRKYPDVHLVSNRKTKQYELWRKPDDNKPWCRIMTLKNSDLYYASQVLKLLAKMDFHQQDIKKEQDKIETANALLEKDKKDKITDELESDADRITVEAEKGKYQDERVHSYPTGNKEVKSEIKRHKKGK